MDRFVDGDFNSDVDGQADNYIPASLAHSTKYKIRLRVSYDYTADQM